MTGNKEPQHSYQPTNHTVEGKATYESDNGKFNLIRTACDISVSEPVMQNTLVTLYISFQQ